MSNHYPKTVRIFPWIVFGVALTLYWITTSPGSAFWDCPEYVLTASLLEVGHPPGNPFWTLAMRVATMFFPSYHHALIINLWSGLFTAFAALLLARTIFFLCKKVSGHSGRDELLAIISAFGGSLCFALCGSVWFSAIEAEVYAMSVFFTSLILWLLTLWWKCRNTGKGKRIIYLIIYLLGLSLGVHQLGLLLVPVIVLVYTYGCYPRMKASLRLLCLAGSLAAVGFVLTGLMGGTVEWAGIYELIIVNGSGGNYNSGVFVYAGILVILLGLSLYSLKCLPVYASLIPVGAFIWQSGFFMAGANLFAGLFMTLIFLLGMVRIFSFPRKILAESVKILSLILTGYSAIGLILIRSAASPPVNESTPDNIFNLASYIAREQYGSTPLLYGRTPFSKPVFEEKYEEGSDRPAYSLYHLKKENPRYALADKDARLFYRSRMVEAEDSLRNNALNDRGKGYIVSDYRFSQVTTPELNMWFPRITGSDASHISAYADWALMTPDNMNEVEISEAVDTAGNFVGLIDESGERTRKTAKKPTAVQNLTYFLSYQLYYMYLRYLGWNFIGKQNDLPAVGEIDHGNVITGISFIDTPLLGDQNLMPYNAGKGNKGRNVLFGIPFLFGLAGIFYLAFSGIRGKKILVSVLLLFLMTGTAIIVYLNQTPIEPRERDYSFLGSYLAYAIFIGIGIFAFGKWVSRVTKTPSLQIAMALVPGLGLPVWMALANFNDNDRRYRDEPYRFASEVLETQHPSVFFMTGDNFTFPMWYAQEVGNKGGHHTLIDQSYLATPAYVINLMKQGEKGLKLSARPTDIGYGAYAMTQIPADNNKEMPELSWLLKDLYSQKEGKPIFSNSKFYIVAGENKDTLVFNLKDFSGGRNVLPFRQLMLLHVIASYNEHPNKRIYFLSAANELTKGLEPHLKPSLFGMVFAPGESDSVYFKSIEKDIENFVNAENKTLKGYIDPTTARQIYWRRAELIRFADYLTRTGHISQGADIADYIDSNYPYDHVPGGVVALGGTNFHEGKEYVKLLKLLADSTGKQSYGEKALFHQQMIDDNKNAWLRYYRSLSPKQRKAVSASARREIAN